MDFLANENFPFARDYGELIYRHKVFIPAGLVYFRFNPATPEEPADILLNIIEKGTNIRQIYRCRERQNTAKKFYGKK